MLWGVLMEQMLLARSLAAVVLLLAYLVSMYSTVARGGGNKVHTNGPLPGTPYAPSDRLPPKCCYPLQSYDTAADDR